MEVWLGLPFKGGRKEEEIQSKWKNPFLWGTCEIKLPLTRLLPPQAPPHPPPCLTVGVALHVVQEIGC